jgi:hypothetical protein
MLNGILHHVYSRFRNASFPNGALCKPFDLKGVKKDTLKITFRVAS